LLAQSRVPKGTPLETQAAAQSFRSFIRHSSFFAFDIFIDKNKNIEYDVCVSWEATR